MALWVNPGSRIPTSADTDILSFYDGQDQPPAPARSILIFADWASSTPLSAMGYDWSRIAAVEIDEPYNGLQHDPCENSGAAAQARGIDATLGQRAAELKALAPKARFWVNFVKDNIGWMEDANCLTQQGLTLNEPYIDVISIDDYGVPFVPDVQQYYNFLVENPAKPDQQLALIPGVFSAPVHQGPLLASYFGYADSMNQACNLPLGSRGVTGIYDGCPVWIVMGWLSGNYTDGNTQYVGMLDTRSATIAAAWEGELGLPLRPGLAHQLTPAQIILPVLNQLLLNN
jgi:hypothetical protein